jgi:simple sugar transport system permease protein
MRVTVSDYVFQLRERTEETRLITYGVPLSSIAVSLLFAAVVLEVIGVSSLAAFGTVVTGLTSLSTLSEVVVRMIPLLIAGLAVYVPMRAGLWNIGAGAGIYAGGIAATAIGLFAPLPGFLLIPAVITGSALAGGAVLFIPGYLRARWDINEILTSLLLTFTFIQLNEYAILLMPAEDITHSSATLRAAAVFPRLGGTRIHLGAAIAVVAFALVYRMMNHSRFGYEIKTFGSNPTAAFQSGISKYKVVIGTFVAGGLLAGVAGGAEIAGIHSRLVPGFSPGFGFTAIAIALIGQRGEFRVLGASLLFSLVYISGAAIELSHNVPFSIIEVFEAIVILFFIAGEAIRRFEIDVQRSDERTEGTVVGQ